MKIIDAKRFMNRTVLLTDRNLSKPTPYKLTGVILREKDGAFYYEVELLDAACGVSSIVIAGLENIEGEIK